MLGRPGNPEIFTHLKARTGEGFRGSLVAIVKSKDATLSLLEELLAENTYDCSAIVLHLKKDYGWKESNESIGGG
jgi:hypothetical protein